MKKPPTLLVIVIVILASLALFFLIGCATVTSPQINKTFEGDCPMIATNSLIA
jgi:hypothetical protein